MCIVCMHIHMPTHVHKCTPHRIYHFSEDCKGLFNTMNKNFQYFLVAADKRDKRKLGRMKKIQL